MEHPERDIFARIMAALAGLGAPRPLVVTRLIDADPEPEPGPYVDIAVSARVLVSDYVKAVGTEES